MPVSRSFVLGKFTFSFQITRSKSASTSESRPAAAGWAPTKQPVEFLTLPPELREMIYRLILVSKEPIQGADRLIGDNVAVLLTEYKPIVDIDSAILRTCRSVYTEALRVLYEQNTFHFSDACAIRRFKDANLQPDQALSLNTRYGRLALIRCVSLKITNNPSYVESSARRRESIWKAWKDNFFSEDRSLYSAARNVGFPALQKVKLDFSDWQFHSDEGIRVAPFVRKLGESGGLQELVVAGLTHESSLTNLRNGLLKRGGKFRVV